MKLLRFQSFFLGNCKSEFTIWDHWLIEAVAPTCRDSNNLLQYHHDCLFSIRVLPLVYIQFTIIEGRFSIQNKI